MVRHRCPTCYQPVSARLFDKITKLDRAKEGRLRAELAAIDTQRQSLACDRRQLAGQKREATRRIAQAREQARAEAQRAQSNLRRHLEQSQQRLRALTREGRRYQNEVSGLRGQIEDQHATFDQRVAVEVKRRVEEGVKAELQRLSASPQRQGIAQERVLADMLRASMPDDQYETPGNRGDVIQTILAGGAVAGRIVYESKREALISRRNCEAAQKARRKAKAEFCVLVHTGTRKGFDGLECDADDIIITRPAGAVAIARILRAVLIERLRLVGQLNRRTSDLETRALLAFLRGHEFTGMLKQLIREADDDLRQLQSEQQATKRWWDGRMQRVERLRSIADAIGDSISARLTAASANVIVATDRFLKRPTTGEVESAHSDVRLTPAQSRIVIAVATGSSIQRPMMSVLVKLRDIGIVSFDRLAPFDNSKWTLTKLGEEIARMHGATVARRRAARV